jgi:hypothetical protein
MEEGGKEKYYIGIKKERKKERKAWFGKITRT